MVIRNNTLSLVYEQTISQMKVFLMNIVVGLIVAISSPLIFIYLLHYTAKVIAKGLTEDDTNKYTKRA